MSDDAKNPVLYQLVFDGSEFAEYAIELTPEQHHGLLAVREGYEDARNEMVANQAELGDTAGITDKEVNDLTTCDARILQESLPAPRQIPEAPRVPLGRRQEGRARPRLP